MKMSDLSLIDHFIAQPGTRALPRALGQELHGLARRAVKFELAAGAVAVTVKTITESPLSLIEHSPVVPFPVTWIEWDQTLFLTTLGGPSTLPAGAERQHGLLFNGNVVYMIGRNEDEDAKTFTWPMCFILNTPMGPPPGNLNDLLATEIHLWGSSWSDLPDHGVTARLSDRHTMRHLGELNPAGPRSGREAVKFAREISIRETVGDLRNVLAILHTLNRRGAVVAGATAGVLGAITASGRRVVRHARGVISINLDLERPVEYARSAPTGITHQVDQRRGGFVDNLTTRLGEANGCAHRWRTVVNYGHAAPPNERYACDLCGGHRWRRRGFKRENGVTVPYLVEADHAGPPDAIMTTQGDLR